MSKILLIALNARYTHSNLAVRYLREIIRREGFVSEIYEASINMKKIEIINAIRDTKADSLIFSVYVWNADLVRSIIPEFRGKNIILGGPEVSYNAGEWLEDLPSINCIISGPGEAAILALAKQGFKVSEPVLKIKNLPLSDIPFPYTADDMPALKNKYIYYESSRGCPFSCTYCLSSREDMPLEFRPVSMVEHELDFLMHYRPASIKFIDRTFNIKQSHHQAIWQKLIKNYSNAGTVFHFEINPGLLKQSDIEILKNAPSGLFRFETGIQSTSPETIKEINRTQDWEHSKKMISLLKDHTKIHLHIDLIAGLPFEGYRKFATSFNDVHGLNPDHLQTGILKILPGTVMAQRSKKYETDYSPEPPYEVIRTKWLSKEELDLIKRIAHIVDFVRNPHKVDTTLKEACAWYGNAFAFYESLADYALKNNTLPHTRSWESSADLLTNWTLSIHPEEILFIKDCLFWDWCLSAKHPKYPLMARTREHREARTAFLKKTGKNPGAIIFTAFSMRFKKKYLNGAEDYIFKANDEISNNGSTNSGTW